MYMSTVSLSRGVRPMGSFFTGVPCMDPIDQHSLGLRQSEAPT
jgi:hypothetical protein